jgi:hypothetical protein
MKAPSKIDVVMLILVLVIVGLVISLFIMSSGSKTQSVQNKQLVECRNSVYGQYASGQNSAELVALSACQKMYGSN